MTQENKMKTKKEQYPRIKQLGLTIITKNPSAIPGIDFKELKEKLTPKQLEQFGKFYGCQTCGENGGYAYDIEAVLERMFSKRLTGTQLFMD